MKYLFPKKLLQKNSFVTTCAVIGTFFVSTGLSTSASAGNMYVFKNSNGQVLLTNVVQNNRPIGQNFSKFNQTVKVTYYADTNVHSYNNWAGNGSTTSASNSANRNSYDALIVASATRNGVDPALMKAMMHTESGFNPFARSPVGAQGLMQLMPATARRFSVMNAWNPAENIEGAAKYINFLQNRFGRIEHVIAGYNAGEGNVSKYGGIPPFRETQDYVKRVLNRYNTLYRHDPSLRGNSNFQTANYSSNINNNVIR